VSTIITAWLFVVGWAYLHTYFAYFGINIASLDFSPYTYFAEDFTQLVSGNTHGVWFGLLILCLVLLAWFGDRIGAPGPVLQLFAEIGTCVAFLFLFCVGFYLARVNAAHVSRQDIDLNTTSLPKVSVETDANHDFVDGDIEIFLGAGELRLLWETKDTMYVFLPVNTAQPKVDVRVVALDRSKILASIRSERIK
jgi:hypothetical protein